MTEAAPPQDKAHRGALLELLGRSMADEHLVVGARCIQALTSMVPHLARADLPAFHALVPPSLAVLKRALPEDEALAREILDLYEEASDINVGQSPSHSLHVNHRASSPPALIPVICSPTPALLDTKCPASPPQAEPDRADAAAAGHQRRPHPGGRHAVQGPLHYPVAGSA